MRIKIGFEFPYFSQKHLLLAHGHFAFLGWATHCFYVYIQEFIQKKVTKTETFSQNIFLNYIFSFGLLFSFLIHGYQLASITFLIASLLNSYIFMWKFYRITKNDFFQHPSIKWFASGLFFQFLSSFGSIYLAWMMFSSSLHQSLYLASVYFYLHFQYSGWFFFTIMGLFTNMMSENAVYKEHPSIFKLFFIATIPAYLLSVLWVSLPWYVFGLAIIAVILQMTGIINFMLNIRPYLAYIQLNWHTNVKILLSVAFFAMTIKLVLQTISVIPSISQLAFGYRSIVIAYLHLVLLGLVTLFIIGYAFHKKLLHISKYSVWIVFALCLTILANEAALMVQGVAGLFFILIPYISEILLLISCFLLLSILALFIHEIITKD